MSGYEGVREDFYALIWKDIKEKYPEVSKEMCKYKMETESLGLEFWNKDDFYEFFDKRYLRGNVHSQGSGTWTFEIYVPKPLPKEDRESGNFIGWDRVSFFTNNSYSRHDAQMALIEEMFKMLEEKYTKT
jgi:hypothetical protein